MKFTPTSLGKTLQRSFSSGLLPIFLAATLATFPVHVPKASAFSGSGAGTEGDPYLITSCTELAEIDEDLTAYYSLQNDLDCVTENFPLARQMSGTTLDGSFDGFTGTLDGNQHTISYAKNIPVEVNQDNYIGLFGYINGGTIQHLNVVGGFQQGPGATEVLYGGEFVGILAGRTSNATILNVHASGDVSSADGEVGGLIGYDIGSVVSYSSYDSAVVSSNAPAGGLVGRSTGGTYSRVYVAGTVSSFGNTGGIIGYAQGVTIEDSYFTGTVYPSNVTFNSGGLVGTVIGGGSITRSYAQGLISCDPSNWNEHMGGLVGVQWDISPTMLTITDSFSAMSIVDADSDAAVVGESFTNTLDNLTFDNVYWDGDVLVGRSCTPYGSPSECSEANLGADPVYWVDPSHEPVAQWNYSSVWNLESDPYPVLFAYGEIVDTYYVSPDGEGTCLDTESPCSLATALDAIELEAVDSTIHLAAGTYDGAFTFESPSSNALTVIADDPDNTIITSSTPGDAFTIYSSGDVTFTNVHFEDSLGAGLVFPTSAYLGAPVITITGSVFANNAGSGIFAVPSFGGTWSLSGNEFLNNSTAEESSGGGIYMNFSTEADIEILDNLFSGNISDADGGGLFIYTSGSDSSINVDDNTFTDNQAVSSGGGAFLRTAGNDSPIVFTDNIANGNGANIGAGAALDTDGDPATDISILVTGNQIGEEGAENVAVEQGGGLHIWAGDALVFAENEIGHNIAAHGGGLYLNVDMGADHLEDVSIADNEFSSNVAQFEGAGVRVGGVDCLCSVAFERNLFYDNSSPDSAGGGLYASVDEMGFPFRLINNIFDSNITYDSGAGAVLDFYHNSGAELWNNTFVANMTLAGFGGGLFIGADDLGLNINLKNTIFYNNFASSADKQDVFLNFYNWDSMVFEDLILSGWAFQNPNTSEYFSYPVDGDIAGFYTANLYQDVDPVFANTGVVRAAYSRLRSTSPALDIGDSEVNLLTPFDYSLNPREQGTGVDLGALEGFADALFDGGDGTDEDPYQISLCSQLQLMDSDLDASYLLISDVDCSETRTWNYNISTAAYQGFESIGDDENRFTGSLNGDGYAIRGLFMAYGEEDDDVGLFSVTEGAVIQNLTLTDGDAEDGDEEDDYYISGQDRVGALVGAAYGRTQIESVTSEINVFSSNLGVVHASEAVGGLVGYLWFSSIENSDTNGQVEGDEQVGGLVGFTENGYIVNSYSTSDVSGQVSVGGLVGQAAEETGIYYSHTLGGEVIGLDSVGGLLGDSYEDGDGVQVVQSFSENSVDGVYYVGGLIGDVSGTLVQNSYANVTVAYAPWFDVVEGEYSDEEPSALGGLLGWAGDATVRNSYSAGSVTGVNGESEYVAVALGGLVGESSGGLVVSNSFAATTLSNGEGDLGGLIGYRTSRVTMENNYFDAELAGTTECYPSAYISGGQCTAINTGEDGFDSTYFYSAENEPFPVWDNDVWYFDLTGYPVLHEGLGDVHLYEIAMCEALQSMQDQLEGDYALVDDVNCSVSNDWNNGQGFVPVGTQISPFLGTLDGQGFIISGLFIDRDADAQGLFGVTQDALISDLNLQTATISGANDVGALVGYAMANTVIQDVTLLYSTVTGSDARVGALVGTSFGEVYIQDADVAGGVSVEGLLNVGGLVGSFEGVDAGQFNLERVSSSAEVDGLFQVGGLLGSLEAAGMKDAYFDGTVGEIVAPEGVLDPPHSFGGLVGSAADFNLQSSYFSGEISATNSDTAGAIVGMIYDQGSISDVFASGEANSVVNGIYGTFGYYDLFSDLVLFETYFDTSLGGTQTCFYEGSSTETGCALVTLEDSYYWADVTHAPLTAWDFESVWTADGESLPHPIFTRQVAEEEEASDLLDFGHWAFDEGAEDTCIDFYDICEEDDLFPGSSQGFVGWVATPDHYFDGENPYALSFLYNPEGGLSSWVDIDMNTAAFDTNFSVAFWIHPDGTATTAATILANGVAGTESDGFKIFLNTWETTDGRLVFEAGNAGTGFNAYSVEDAIPSGEWSHVVVTVDAESETVTFYVNGEDQTEVGDMTISDFHRGGDWRLGMMQDDSYFYSGYLDDLIIENRVYSLEDAQDLAGLNEEESEEESSSGGSSGGGVGFVGGGSRGGGGGGGGRSSTRGSTATTSAAGEEEADASEDNGSTVQNGVVTFSDTQTHWAHEYIDILQEQCGVDGYRDEMGHLTGKFGPEALATRAELVKILLGCLGEPISGVQDLHFTDLTMNDWFTPYVETAFAKGLIRGYEDGLFRPNQYTVRAEAIKMILLARYSDAEIVDAGASSFTDVSDTEWYARYVDFAAAHGIVSGLKNSDGTLMGLFAPGKQITRAEVAKMVVNLLFADQL